jgi:hypothetical protein
VKYTIYRKSQLFPYFSGLYDTASFAKTHRKNGTKELPWMIQVDDIL